VPIVLDPVGVGASALRNDSVAEILRRAKVSVIRGNVSEIGFIAGQSSGAKGVDASAQDLQKAAQNSAKMAAELAAKLDCVVAVTGAVDIVSDGKRTAQIANGHKMLGSITGTGCMCSTLIGAALGTTSDAFIAAASGITFMGISGEIAHTNAGKTGTSTFRTALIDAISTLNPATINNLAKTETP